MWPQNANIRNRGQRENAKNTTLALHVFDLSLNPQHHRRSPEHCQGALQNSLPSLHSVTQPPTPDSTHTHTHKSHPSKIPQSIIGYACHFSQHFLIISRKGYWVGKDFKNLILSHFPNYMHPVQREDVLEETQLLFSLRTSFYSGRMWGILSSIWPSLGYIWSPSRISQNSPWASLMCHAHTPHTVPRQKRLGNSGAME